MRFALELFDPLIKDLSEGVERTLQRIGPTTIVDDTSHPPSPHNASLDGILTLTHSNGLIVRFACEAKRTLSLNGLPPIIERLKTAAAAVEAKPLLLAPYVGDPTSKQLRADEISYLDTAGNAYLKDSLLFIWFRGFKLPQKPEKIVRAFQTSGLQLIALLLSQPSAIEWPYRKLADGAGIALGSVSRIVSDLRSLGFVRLVGSGRNILEERRKLLDRWEFGYTTRLRPRLNPQTYRQAEDLPVEQLPELILPALREEVLVGGELAAAIATKHLRPQSVTFHVSPNRPLPPITKEMKLIPDRSGNIVFLEQFGEMSAWKWQSDRGSPLVHPLLVYSELVHGKPDSRLAETARIIRERFLAPTFDGLSVDGR